MLDEVREFCCGGCLAVAEEISAAGLAEYYGLANGRCRDGRRSARRSTSGIYDREDLQESFRPAATESFAAFRSFSRASAARRASG